MFFEFFNINNILNGSENFQKEKLDHKYKIFIHWTKYLKINFLNQHSSKYTEWTYGCGPDGASLKNVATYWKMGKIINKQEPNMLIM